MHTLRFWFDPVSPFAWLAFQQLPLALSGISHRVVYTPVFLGPLLRAHGQLGPAEVPPKRAWTYRHVQWLAHQLAEPLEMPLRHPFNPVALLRLALAAVSKRRASTVARCRLVSGLWLRSGKGSSSAFRDATAISTVAESSALPASKASVRRARTGMAPMPRKARWTRCATEP